MFLFRSIFWLGIVVMILPPASDGTPAPRVSLLEALAAARTFARDIGETCERNPHACDIGGDTLGLVRLKAETGMDIIGAVISSYRGRSDAGTLTDEDLTAGWAGQPDN